MKKRLSSMVMCAALCFMLAGCGGSEEATTVGTATTGTADTSSTASTDAGNAETGTTEGKTLQEEILSFVGVDIPAIESERNEAIALYNAYFADDSTTTSDVWMTTLSEQALPKFDSYLTKLNAIEVVHEDVKELKKLYVESADLQRAAIEDVINAIKNVDSGLLEYAQEKVTSSYAKLSEYEKNLKNLCAANNIELKGNVVPTEAADEDSEGATEAAE